MISTLHAKAAILFKSVAPTISSKTLAFVMRHNSLRCGARREIRCKSFKTRRALDHSLGKGRLKSWGNLGIVLSQVILARMTQWKRLWQRIVVSKQAYWHSNSWSQLPSKKPRSLTSHIERCEATKQVLNAHLKTPTWKRTVPKNKLFRRVESKWWYLGRESSSKLSTQEAWRRIRICLQCQQIDYPVLT